MPPLWPERKNFWNTLDQKIFLNFWGGGTSPPHTPPHRRLRRLEPRVFGSAPPLHKILNTPLLGLTALPFISIRTRTYEYYKHLPVGISCTGIHNCYPMRR